MKKFRITMWCNDVSEVEVEANSKEDAESKLWTDEIWNKTYPNSIHQSGEDYKINEL